MEIKWIKIVTNIFDDEKILLIESMPEGDAIIVIWFKLLCLAGKQNNQGIFMLNDKIPYTDEMLATIFRKNVKTVRLALETFKSFGMVEVIEGAITIPNWSKHQSIEQLENKKEYMREYMREYRNSKKVLTDCKPLRKTNVSSLEKEIEIEYNTHKKTGACASVCDSNKTLSVFIENTGLNDAYQIDGFDYELIASEIDKSKKFLKTVTNFDFFVSNYERIIKGTYRDFADAPKKTNKGSVHFENERVYTPQEMNALITSVDEIEI